MSELIVPVQDKRVFIGIEIKKSQAHLYWKEVCQLIKTPPTSKTALTLDAKNVIISLKSQPIEAVHRSGDTISIFTKRYHIEMTAILQESQLEDEENK
jgi:hypothetical protein